MFLPSDIEWPEPARSSNGFGTLWEIEPILIIQVRKKLEKIDIFDRTYYITWDYEKSVFKYVDISSSGSYIWVSLAQSFFVNPSFKLPEKLDIQSYKPVINHNDKILNDITVINLMKNNVTYNVVINGIPLKIEVRYGNITDK